MRILTVLRCTLALALVSVAAGAFAQGWPAKPVKFIVPFPPGGGADATGRIVVQELSRALGQQFVVENRGGGGGTIGVATGMKSATDTLAGQVPVAFLDTTSSLALVRSGKLRSLGTTGEKRTALAPEMATLAESGLPGFDASGWFILGAPSGVPREIITRLNAETVRALAVPEVRERLLASGNEPISSSPEELGAFIRDEIQKWAKVIKVAGVKAD